MSETTTLNTIPSNKNKQQDKLLLIDGSNLAFRMFFALEMTNLRNSEGHPTWAIYGTIKALFDVIDATQPTGIAVAFDLPEPSFRHECFDDYKANRPDEMPDELQQQWPLIMEAFTKFDIPVMTEAGFEADDIIGVMARKAEAAGQEVVILSGDKDLFQLVTDKVTVAMPQRGGGLKMFDPEAVIENMGVRPDQVPDYKGIAGDSSDNIPGVKGIGPKGTIKLLDAYDKLESIYEQLDDVAPPKMQEKLREQEESARHSKYLATIITDAQAITKCDTSLETCKLRLPDTDELITFLKSFEINTILKRLPIVLKPFNGGQMVKVDVGDLPRQEQNTGSKTSNKNKVQQEQAEKMARMEIPLSDFTTTPTVITTKEALDAAIEEINQVSTYAIDLETDGLNTNHCNIVGWAISYAPNFDLKNYKRYSNKGSVAKSNNEELFNLDEEIQSYYIPVAVDGQASLLETAPEYLKPELVLKKLKPLLENKAKLQVVQNAKFEHKILNRLGIKIHSSFFDTMLASYVDNSSNKHGLKAQSKRVFHQRMTEFEDIVGTGRKQIPITDVEIHKLAGYAAADAVQTLKLYSHYINNLEESSLKLLQEVEQPLVTMLAEMEMTGVSIDSEFLANLSEEIHMKINKLQKTILEIAGEEFNVSSPKQLSNILFDKLNIKPVGKKNKNGAYSTDIGTLETLLNDYDLEEDQKAFVESVVDYRGLTKLASTYIDNLPKLVDKDTGRLHSDFNQVVTATGRLSSSNPNLQNIPIKTNYGRQIRKAFIAKNPEDYILSADYSQVELRVLAHMAGADILIDAFNNDQDIHKRTAMEIFDMTEDEVGDEERRVGKTLNFALIYMQGPFATAKQLGITMKEAREFIKKYFAAFPHIQPFMNETLEKAHEEQFVETLFGRRRYFQNINSNNKIIAKEEERQAFNAAIQGTAADIIKKAMITLAKEIKERHLKSKIILQVHDELVLEVAKDELEEVTKLTQETMANAAKLSVPLKVDASYGANWLEAK